MIKRPKGNGPHMVIEIPNGYDCEYYTRNGYCKYTHKRCTNRFSSVSNCSELRKPRNSENKSKKQVHKAKVINSNAIPYDIKKKLDALKNCKAAKISNNKELNISFTYDINEKKIYYSILNISKPLNNDEITNLISGMSLKNEERDFRIYGSLNKFMDRHKNFPKEQKVELYFKIDAKKLKIGQYISHRSLGNGVISSIQKNSFNVKFERISNDIEFKIDELNNDFKIRK